MNDTPDDCGSSRRLQDHHLPARSWIRHEHQRVALPVAPTTAVPIFMPNEVDGPFSDASPLGYLYGVLLLVDHDHGSGWNQFAHGVILQPDHSESVPALVELRAHSGGHSQFFSCLSAQASLLETDLALEGQCKAKLMVIEDSRVLSRTSGLRGLRQGIAVLPSLYTEGMQDCTIRNLIALTKAGDLKDIRYGFSSFDFGEATAPDAMVLIGVFFGDLGGQPFDGRTCEMEFFPQFSEPFSRICHNYYYSRREAIGRWRVDTRDPRRFYLYWSSS